MLKKSIVKGIIWKEFRIFAGISFFLCVFYTVLLLWAYYENIGTLIELESINQDSYFAVYATMVVFIMNMTGGTILSQSVGTDKKEGILNSLLGTFHEPKYIWYGQLLFSSFISYIFSIAGILALGLKAKYCLKVKISFLWHQYLQLIIVVPVICVFILSIYNFLLWVIKNQALQMIITILPAFSYIFALGMINFISKAVGFFQITVILIVGLFSMVGIWIVGYIVNKVPKSIFICKI